MKLKKSIKRKLDNVLMIATIAIYACMFIKGFLFFLGIDL